MAGYEHITMLDSRRVLDVGLVVISAGLLFFFVARVNRGQTPLSSETADIGVSAEGVTPGVTPEKRGDTGGDKRGDSEVTRRVTMVSPPVSPTVTSIASVSPAVQKSPSPGPSSVSSPSPAPSPAPSKTPTPLVVVSPSPMPILSPTPTQPVGTAHVVINEIAWMGTEASANDEWIELFNPNTVSVDLNGWRILIAGDNSIMLTGSIAPGSYYLLERTNNDPVSGSDYIGDYIGSFGRYGLSDTGEHLTLVNSSGAKVDDVDCGNGWHAGLKDKGLKTTMERVDPNKNGDSPSNWASNDGITTIGFDAAGNPIKGTPKARNSVAQ